MYVCPLSSPLLSFQASSKKASFQPSFANGLVGSDVEVPNFDPFGLSAGRSAETLQVSVRFVLYLEEPECLPFLCVVGICVIDH